MEALLEFGFGSVGLTETDFEEEGRLVRLGVPPVRVDIITSISLQLGPSESANEKLGHREKRNNVVA